MRAAVVAVALLATTAPSISACLHYNARVRLAGTIATRVFPGPPNFESVAAGDRPETVMLLRLRAPVCVSGGSTADTDVNVDKIDTIQLIPDDDLREALKRGSKVVVSGSFMGANTGHHRTPVVLVDVKVER